MTRIYVNRLVAVIPLLLVSNAAWSALVLHIDTSMEELYLEGSDSGAIVSENSLLWAQPGWLAVNNQGIGLPTAEEHVLNLNVSWTSEAVAMYFPAEPGDYVFTATNDRFDYSWMLPEVKTLLSDSHGVEMLAPSLGVVGYDSISVVVDGAAVVPIPAAGWLFGSALLGLGVFKRKKA